MMATIFTIVSRTSGEIMGVQVSVTHHSTKTIQTVLSLIAAMFGLSNHGHLIIQPVVSLTAAMVVFS